MRNYNKNEYEDTKRLLNVLRKLNESKFNKNTINENVFKRINEDEDLDAIDDANVKVTTDGQNIELEKEEKDILNQITTNFKTQVSKYVDFEPGFSIVENQIRLDGKISDYDISFVYIAGGDDSGVYINAEMLDLTEKDDIIETLEKLKIFNETFQTSAYEIIEKRKDGF